MKCSSMQNYKINEELQWKHKSKFFLIMKTITAPETRFWLIYLNVNTKP